MKKQKILLAMSGGVDSSVAALLLKKQGYEVVGAFMVNWSDTKNKLTGECAWRDEKRIAMKIAARLGIKFITLNFEKEYKKSVVDKMFKDYKKGITPNPDIDCNNKIKFPLLIREAKKLKCDFIATGHYARIKKRVLNIEKNNLRNKISKFEANRQIYKSAPGGWRGSEALVGGADATLQKQEKLIIEEGNNNKNKKIVYELLRAKDELKDQSYFLYRIKQNELKNILFPIGEYTKKQIREIAKKNKFSNYDKKSTVGICFIGKINLKEFLKKRIKPKKGIILNPNGNKIGEHDGIFYYTIGQRIGSRYGIEISKPEKMQKKWYVARKIPNKNIIIAAPEGHELNFRKEIIIKNPYWINREDIKKELYWGGRAISRKKFINSRMSGVASWAGIKKKEKIIKVLSRIRQVGELLPSVLKYKNKKYKIILNKAITGVSQGQAIVLYQGEKCLGGGVIGFEY